MAEGGDNLLSRHHEDFGRILGPDYNLVLECSSPEQPARLFNVVHASVSRNAPNYRIVLQLAGEELPRKDTSLCELTASCVYSNASNGEMPRHFFGPGGDDLEIGDVLTEHSEVSTKPVAESIVPDQENYRHNLQHRGGEVRDVLPTSVRIVDLKRQVRLLESELDNARKENTARQVENGILHRRLDKLRSALQQSQQANEQLRVRVADVERDRYLATRSSSGSFVA